MAKSILDRILDNIFDADWVGRRGEKLTERELKLVQLFGRKGKVLRNVYLPKDDGGTSEVDVVFITQKGIFVIESKNYSGWIFGDEQAAYWTVMLPNKQKNKLYNPIKQNRTHMKWMKAFLQQDIPLFSLVVFSERCELKKVSVTSTDVYVLQRDRLYATVRNIWDATEDVLGEDDITRIFAQLQKLTNADEAVKAAHIASIQERYAAPQKAKQPTQNAKENTQPTSSAPRAKPSVLPIQETPSAEDDIQQAESAPDTTPTQTTPLEKPCAQPEQTALDATACIPPAPTTPLREMSTAITTKTGNATDDNTAKICPKCGAPLILRTAKRGDNAGKQFYGCSHYPKCRYILNIE